MKSISVLPILFLGLCVASHAGAQSKATLLVKTEKTCNWTLDGQPMGLITAERPIVVLVTPGQHRLEASPTDGTATIFSKVEIDTADTVEKTVNIGRKPQPRQQGDTHRAETQKEPALADAAQNPTWTDPSTGLMWTAKDNGSDLDQPQAADYCSTLQYAGYSGWRLPTLEELQGIYDPRSGAENKVVSNIQDEVHVKGGFNLSTGRVWSDHLGDHPGRPYQTAWLLQFFDSASTGDKGVPLRNFLHFTFHMRALCVHGPRASV